MGFLTSLAPVVAFSAAVPCQVGTHHVNEQYAGYWARLFQDCGYEPFDVIRPRCWYDRDIEFYYRQNLVIYVAASQAELDLVVQQVTELVEERERFVAHRVGARQRELAPLGAVEQSTAFGEDPVIRDGLVGGGHTSTIARASRASYICHNCLLAVP